MPDELAAFEARAAALEGRLREAARARSEAAGARDREAASAAKPAPAPSAAGPQGWGTGFANGAGARRREPPTVGEGPMPEVLRKADGEEARLRAKVAQAQREKARRDEQRQAEQRQRDERERRDREQARSEPVGASPQVDHAGEILQFARILGLDMVHDAHLLWIAEEFWLAPMPDGWEESETPDGTLYYYDAEGNSQWEHPHESFYQSLVFMSREGRAQLERTQAEFPPSDVEVGEMADYFECDLAREPFLRDIVRSAVGAPLPPGWAEDPASGNFRFEDGHVSQAHPLDGYFTEMIRRARYAHGTLTVGGRQTTGKQLKAAEAVMQLAAQYWEQGKAPDPFKMLGLAPGGCTRRDAKTQFRALSLLVHPDKNPSPAAKPAFEAVTAAYKEVVGRLPR